MNKLFTLLLLLCSIAVTAQTQPFGKVDTADLKLTSCDFEKGANTMVLFDEAKAYYRFSTVVMERHKRIKIFNEKGSDQAQVKIEFLGVNHDELVTDVEAQTINFEDNAIKYIPVDKALIYKQNIDRKTNAIVFTFPNVKPGSIVEFKYRWSSPYAGNFPNWLFQDVIPTRYSEFQCSLNDNYIFKLVKRIRQNFAKDTSVFKNGKNKRSGYTHIWALSNVHSLRDEPYMASIQDNVQELLFQVTGRFGGYWSEEALGLLKYDDFGAQLDTTINLSHQESIIAEANKLPGRDEKIAYLFNTVKNTIKWNNLTRFYTEDGVRRAWNKKTGNSAEINMILYHYLKKAGINAQVMVINTHDKLDPYYASTRQLNSLVAYVIDDKTQYVLDASQKDGLYNELPFYLLNSNGVVIYQERKVAMLLDLTNPSPKQNAIFINAEVTPDAKMTGTAQINNSSYNKMSVIKRYKADGEAGYKVFLQEKDNNLKITSFKLENMEVDSLPLTQTIEFDSDLNGSDENYIYFAPNLFTGLNSNPFLDEERYSHIDFKFLRRYNINGRYKIPAGFKIDAIPKSLTVLMPDSSISFKRMVAGENGFVIVHYVVDFKRSYYAVTEYQLLYEFYKKMYQMLNEQIVLKKD